MSLRKKTLTLSIIIPVYNERRYLRSCLESIVRQTSPPDEVIVVDNNSTDGSGDIAKEFPFVRIVSEEKQGIVYARDAGFNASKSDILGRIDADTILPQNWVTRVKNFYEAPVNQNYALTGGGYFYNVYFPPKSVGGWILSQIIYRFNRLIMGHYILWGSNMAIMASQWRLVRKKVCLRNDIHEDLDLAIHLHQKHIEITYEATLKVGVAMKRVFDNYAQLRENLMLWPRTLRTHNNKRWVFGFAGACLLYVLSPILFAINKPVQLLRKLSG